MCCAACSLPEPGDRHAGAASTWTLGAWSPAVDAEVGVNLHRTHQHLYSPHLSIELCRIFASFKQMAMLDWLAVDQTV